MEGTDGMERVLNVTKKLKVILFMMVSLFVIGILGFIPKASNLLASLLNINMATTWLHLVIGLISLIVAYIIKD